MLEKVKEKLAKMSKVKFVLTMGLSFWFLTTTLTLLIQYFILKHDLGGLSVVIARYVIGIPFGLFFGLCMYNPLGTRNKV